MANQLAGAGCAPWDPGDTGTVLGSRGWSGEWADAAACPWGCPGTRAEEPVSHRRWDPDCQLAPSYNICEESRRRSPKTLSHCLFVAQICRIPQTPCLPFVLLTESSLLWIQHCESPYMFVYTRYWMKCCYWFSPDTFCFNMEESPFLHFCNITWILE